MSMVHAQFLCHEVIVDVLLPEKLVNVIQVIVGIRQQVIDDCCLNFFAVNVQLKKYVIVDFGLWG